MLGSSQTGELAAQRLLVTGATGFIGTRLCRRAASGGAIVHAVSRRARPVRGDDLQKGVHRERADITDNAAVEALVRRVRPDVVVHLAGNVSGARDRDLVLPMLQANLLGAVNVMLAADTAGCRRVVLAGSVEEPNLADSEALVRSPYGAAKWAAQAYARLFHSLYELPVVHLRVSMVYGPEQRDIRKLVPYVTLALLRGEAPQLMSGTREIDWIYVDDVVEAFLAAATAPSVDGRSLDIGSGELVSVRTLVGRLRRLVGADVEPVFGALPDRKLERARVADPAAAAAAMDWRPETSLDEGLARTVDFYRHRLGRLSLT
jgi:nucleoside-diphosphate-sugar epimerase